MRAVTVRVGAATAGRTMGAIVRAVTARAGVGMRAGVGVRMRTESRSYVSVVCVGGNAPPSKLGPSCPCACVCMEWAGEVGVWRGRHCDGGSSSGIKVPSGIVHCTPASLSDLSEARTAP